MDYNDIVRRVRDVFENADAREIFEHLAIQVNVYGEGSGIFYIEIAERQICVEPYDYYDHDILITIDSSVLMDIMDGKVDYREAMEDGRIGLMGTPGKAKLLRNIRFPKK